MTFMMPKKIKLIPLKGKANELYLKHLKLLQNSLGHIYSHLGRAHAPKLSINKPLSYSKQILIHQLLILAFIQYLLSVSQVLGARGIMMNETQLTTY